MLLNAVLTMARAAVQDFLEGPEQRQAATDLARLSHRRVAVDRGDLQLVWARTLAWSGAITPDAAPWIRTLLDEDDASQGLAVDPELRWALVTALCATGERTSADLTQDLRADFTMTGQTAYDLAMASLPTAQTKATAWHSLVEAHGDGLTNDRQRALIAGFGQPASSHLTRDYAPRYFQVLGTVWEEQSQTMAMRFVNGMFPAPQTDRGHATDHSTDQDPVVLMARGWLTGNADAPAALRRGVIEGLDDAERILRVRAAG